jgi:uncharacterized membrane protein YhdT
MAWMWNFVEHTRRGVVNVPQHIENGCKSPLILFILTTFLTQAVIFTETSILLSRKGQTGIEAGHAAFAFSEILLNLQVINW